MNLIKEIKKLGFPPDSYIIVGSGHLSAIGLKEPHDIDIVVTKDLFAKCKKEGWEQMPFTYPDKLGHIFLRKGFTELYLDVNKGNFNPTIEELIQRAVIIDGVPFASFEDILNFKREYGKVNSKHLLDIELIEKHLENS